MTQRTALVTGAFGGLGEAICLRLAQDGFRVVGVHHHLGDAETEWNQRMRSAGVHVDTAVAEIQSFDSCVAMAADILTRIGPIDIVINNAGITHDMSFRKMQPADWAGVLETNLFSVFNVTKCFIESMVERGFGRVINIASVNGQKGAFGQTNYAASKAGMHGFTKSLALEVAAKGVTVNTVSPGYLDTKMVRKVPENVLKEKVLPQIPVGRLGQPAEVAALVSFLASEEAGFVTGADFSINGGQHMH
jgi:acetoacetyl-CoA reductase